MTRGYAALCAFTGGLLLILGIALFGSFVVALMPDSGGPLPFPMSIQGYYFVAFAGSALVAWGSCLWVASRGPGARSIGTATALGLTLCGLFRMLAWLMGDLTWIDSALRIEAALFLLLALAFVWLRPPAQAEGRG